MTREPLPDAGPPARAADLQLAGTWLARHDLAGARPTPLLASRLAVRRRARRAAHVILAVLILASALAAAYDRLASSAFGGFQPHRPLPLLALTALVAGLLPAQSLTADVIMRVEDARDLTTPNVQWSLPMVLLFGTAPGWWSAASVAYLILGLVACVALHTRTPSSATVARRAMSVR
ncbi:hypothetical protein [Microbispora hainanensis]|uniref:Uncharacterized protein n=1 Tax=Microbispora hainanensis TaxID=568844 RepID=A0A544YXZ8_9ACTN|nr:hypothetical protein [Microbispora hainanensis]TQS21638.1 hypothetical protein FLX08_10550 [Microbispora hainanensis]